MNTSKVSSIYKQNYQGIMEIPSKKRERSTMENSEQINTCDLNSNFCIQIANHVLLEKVEKGSNFVISPVSFQIMLSLVATGATGRTLDQLLLFLGSKGIEDLNSLSSQVVELTTGQDSDDKKLDSGPIVAMVNGAWIDQSFGLKPSFKGTLADVYKAEAKVVDFTTRVSLSFGSLNIVFRTQYRCAFLMLMLFVLYEG